MKIESTSFKNTIAYKFFLLFILSAIIPISLFALFSIYQMDKVLDESIQIELQNNAKSYVHSLDERLTAFNFALEQSASEIKLTRDSSKWQNKIRYKNWFKSLTLMLDGEPETIFWGKPPALSALSNDRVNFLQGGKTLILITADAKTKIPNIIMLKQVFLGKKQRALVVGELNLNVLWGNEDSFDLRKTFCVINHDKIVLFCSKSNLKNSLLSIISQVKFISRGKLTWSDTNEDIYVGYTSIFMQYNFFQRDWRIIFAQPKAESIYQKVFDSIFYKIFAFALVLVTYIGFITIRQQMKPLDALMKGISRITNSNFNKPVPILGNDEFGQLATEFNFMSERLKTQLNVLTTLSEIDQMILSKLSKIDIIRMVTEHANDIIESDSISITLLTQEMTSQVIMYTADSQSTNGISEQIYQIRAETMKEIISKRSLQFDQSHKQWHDSVSPLKNRGYYYYLIIPIGIQENTSAFLTFAYQKKPNLSLEIIEWGQEFAARIAVAISNASWEKKLYQQAHFDSLTGLPNRLLFQDRLQHAIDKADRDNLTPVILFLDLDQFKKINDSLGHMAGDNLLKKVAKRIMTCIRKSDTVARIGGDEFVILLDGHNNPTSFELESTLRKILSEISKPLSLEGNNLQISTSIGVAIYPQDGNNLEKLLRNADTALYEAKKRGKSRYQFYSEQLNVTLLKNLLLEADLHKALKKNEFKLHYQAQIDVKTGLIVGAEVLLRWFHPEKGLISPNIFIPLLEQSGLIIPIGNWVMREACHQNKQWQQKGLPKIRIAINLSTKQFTNKTLFDDFKLIIEESGLETRYIEIEVTESTAVDDLAISVAITKKIKSLGVNIGIDDYGTGYSSLQYIKDFPVDTLKIDRSFINDLVQSNKEQAIVRSTITLAHDLKLKIIAEGVEDEAQYSLLKKLGCDQVQGYYFSKPIHAENFEKLLANNVIKSPDEET